MVLAARPPKKGTRERAETLCAFPRFFVRFCFSGMKCFAVDRSWRRKLSKAAHSATRGVPACMKHPFVDVWRVAPPGTKPFAPQVFKRFRFHSHSNERREFILLTIKFKSGPRAVPALKMVRSNSSRLLFCHFVCWISKASSPDAAALVQILDAGSFSTIFEEEEYARHVWDTLNLAPTTGTVNLR